METVLFRLQLLATIYMVGLIWFVQLVHYPMFADVDRDSFVAYESIHQQRTTWAVGPPMLLELGTAIAYLWLRPAGHPDWVAWVGLGLLAVLWLSTALWFGPAHGRLSGGFDAKLHWQLVNFNWLRTVAWTARGALLVWMIGR